MNTFVIGFDFIKTIPQGSRYGSPPFLSGEPELELTTPSDELISEIPSPAGFTISLFERLFFLQNVLDIQKSDENDYKSKF